MTVHESPDHLVSSLERLTERLLEDGCVDLTPSGLGPIRRSNGRPTSESVLERRYTTEAILDEERAIADWADERFSDTGGPAQLLDVERLDPVQAHAAALVAGTHPLVVIVGPAGTGKTTMLRAAVDNLAADGRTAFGLASSAVAAEVLAEEARLPADTVDKLLAEYHKIGQLPDPQYLLPAGSTVIVDEFGTLSTPKLASLAALAEHMDWRIVLVGDPLQFAAVGRGGMFQHLIEHAPDGAAVEHLDRVHRFNAEWEADASLRLRQGDVTALDDYNEHGRIKRALTAGDGRRQLVDRWWELRQDGNDVVMFAATNQSATALNLAAQRRLLAAGEVVQPIQRAGLADGTHALVGDDVQTRRNDRSLATDMGTTVKNRHRWTVEDVGADGSVTVSDADRGRVTLPADYAANALTLAYASTAMAGQGRTVDHSLVLVDGPIDAAGLYVPMTRGRSGNEVWVVADQTSSTNAIDQLTGVVQRRWIDEPAIDQLSEAGVLDEQGTDVAGIDL